MPPKTQDPAGGTDPNTAATLSDVERERIAAAAREEALAADRTRREEISALLDAQRLFRGTFADDTAYAAWREKTLNDSTMTKAKVGEAILAKLAEGAAPINHPGYTPRVEAGESDDDKWARAVSQSIMARCGADKPDAANPVRGFRLLEIARAGLERRGIKTGNLSALDLAAKALGRGAYASGAGMTTSDLPVLLENTMHKMVLTGFRAQPDSWSLFCKQGTVSDFRNWKRLSTGLFGNLDDVLETGEYKYKTLPDATAESVAATRKGNIIRITPEILINDDTAYIADVTNMMGRGAKRTVEAKVYSVLNANAALSDGNALFHASHNNLAGTAAAPTVASLAAARLAMGKQRDVGNVEYLDIRPSIWVGPDTYRDEVNVINESQYDTDATGSLKPNKSRGVVQTVVGTPRLTGTAWYLFADPQIAPVIEVVFLDGQTEPMLAMEEDFHTAGISYRVEYPHGVGVIDFRGGYKNAGA